MSVDMSATVDVIPEYGSGGHCVMVRVHVKPVHLPDTSSLFVRSFPGIPERGTQMSTSTEGPTKDQLALVKGDGDLYCISDWLTPRTCRQNTNCHSVAAPLGLSVPVKGLIQLNEKVRPAF